MKILIVGVGKLGFQLAEAFSHKENDIIVMDPKAEALQKASDQLDVLTIQQNGVEVKSLKQARIHEIDLVLAVTDDDETNMLIAFLSKRMGCKKSIARVRNPEYSRQAEFIKKEMSIDYIVNPELATSSEIIRYLMKGLPVHTEDFAHGKIVLADVKVQNLCGMAGQYVKDLNYEERVLIAALNRNGNVIIPHGETEIIETDVLYVIGEKDDVNSFTQRCGISTKKKMTRKVVILGGGRIGYYLADKLLKTGVQVKIIEESRNRCKYLAETLNDALVIHGDGTDINLLEEESIFEADALISLTGLDEENLLLSLLAKQYNTKKVIAKVSRPNYIPIIEKLGVDVAVNPVTITASEILRYVQGGKVLSFSLLFGGKAEVTELIVRKNAYVTEKKLKDLELPQGLIIGSVLRKNKVIIPDGETIITAGDRVVIFAVKDDETDFEKYFYPSKRGLLNELWSYHKSSR
ncbi:trk system potassium uptake protein TrkA [Tindallia magadiensis]|uniref:Trk system potassium uptake protein TrkA n=1 Tax=Tindallia magadiensis TaxID=69895 RepID=A0A1I3AU49_9FIRM|nr:Trk system potassium transporter TrkA [Tindallia magadiensis]SFH53648.1 trk system potassium uptake protein TrkA [Tindallia magadiensis]